MTSDKRSNPEPVQQNNNPDGPQRSLTDIQELISFFQLLAE
jgi:hypothetical protein